MTERPIIFSTEMVRAILEGRKTQSRRVINPQPAEEMILRYRFPKCPYGQVGNRLWVRESFYTESGDIWYKADGQTAPMLIKWRPAIYIPKWLTRIRLEITEVRVERLQEITAEEAMLEGYPITFGKDWVEFSVPWFTEIWDSLNAKRGYGWGSNPWVWVISFRRL